MTMNSKQAAEAIALAKKKKLFLMEGDVPINTHAPPLHLNITIL
jgi:predicted dehydrogenase